MTVTDPTLRVPCFANFGHKMSQSKGALRWIVVQLCRETHPLLLSQRVWRKKALRDVMREPPTVLSCLLNQSATASGAKCARKGTSFSLRFRENLTGGGHRTRATWPVWEESALLSRPMLQPHSKVPTPASSLALFLLPPFSSLMQSVAGSSSSISAV